MFCEGVAGDASTQTRLVSAFRVSTGLHVEHRRPKAGDAPHEGLLQVERRGFRGLGFRCFGFRGEPRSCVCQRLGPFWVHFGSILGPFWVHFGSVLGPFWVRFGSVI